jgi:hypothetical protein
MSKKRKVFDAEKAQRKGAKDALSELERGFTVPVFPQRVSATRCT